MTSWMKWIIQHADQAHWLIFAAALLAGFSLPISIDLLILASAILAATAVPDNTLQLFLAIFLGSYLSASIAYWIGRLGGQKLLKINWFAKFLTPQRLKKIQNFYHKRGLITLILGRFIPFGIRNGLFMSIGISSFSFRKFLLWDLLAVFIWSTSCFYLFYKIGENYETLYSHLKTFQVLLLICLSVTLISLFWYKYRRKKLTEISKQ